MTTFQAEPRVIPAQLSFFTIYSPALGKTDETFPDQLVFHWSRTPQDDKGASWGGAEPASSARDAREEENERLRQIGLAQGMVDFAKTFSEGKPIESIETEKSRVIVRELEDGWWALASIDLTRLPKASPSTGPSLPDGGHAWEYSAREVSPPALLNQQITTAHRTFSLHHGISLDEFMIKNGRVKLGTVLGRFWTRFCRYWEVLLHGNPAVSVLGGLKLSAGGELGIGVGEEEWGSGEREVLEDLVHRTEGLVDLVVTRFGEAPVASTKATITEADLPWIGNGRPPDATDGVIFGGVGALTRKSVRDVAVWTEHIYMYGEYAYGVKDNPLRERKKARTRGRNNGQPTEARGRRHRQARDYISGGQRQRSAQQSGDDKTPTGSPSLPISPAEPVAVPQTQITPQDHAIGRRNGGDMDARPSIPPPIVSAVERSLSKAITSADTRPADDGSGMGFGVSDKWMKYLTLGLSTIGKSEERPEEVKEDANYWPRSRPSLPPKYGSDSSKGSDWSTETLKPSSKSLQILQEVAPIPEAYPELSKIAEQIQLETEGYFLIGYRGRLSDLDEGHGDLAADDEESGRRLLLRTLHVQKNQRINFEDDKDLPSDHSTAPTIRNDMTTEKNMRTRVVVYIRRPFIYTFMFEQRTETLSMAAFYKTLHHHLSPLQKPMSNSTSAVQVASRIEESTQAAVAPDSPRSNRPSRTTRKALPVYDLLYDPIKLTVHSSIPNIPLPGTPAAEGLGLAGDTTWSRIEALNVHSQILNTLESTASSPNEIERSCKTTRGWWVVWMRLPPSDVTPPQSTGSATGTGQATTSTGGGGAREYTTHECRVAVLVRKASDWIAPKTGSGGGRIGSGMFGLGGRAEDITGGASAGWGPASLAGGTGFDARKYVEGLLSLNR